jgi:integration host factor subunit alpha
MTGKNITRMDLADATYQKVGLSRTESADLIGQVLEGISASLTVAENVKLPASASSLYATGQQNVRAAT